MNVTNTDMVRKDFWSLKRKAQKVVEAALSRTYADLDLTEKEAKAIVDAEEALTKAMLLLAGDA